MRWLFILFVGLIAGFLFLLIRKQQHNEALPVFLLTDTIAKEHHTNVNISINSLYKPATAEIDVLKKDYSAIWAHLNYLYETNDVEKGKEYYTEDWFKQICSHLDNKLIPSEVYRKDVEHNLLIQNWESDGLVCTVIDSNVVFKYTYANSHTIMSKATLAVVLLFQGDHWRIDAIRVINEKKI